MRKLNFALVVMLVLLVSSVTAFAYVSDRHDFGEIDFGGATVTFVAHFDNLTAFQEGGARAGRLEEAKELFNIGDIVMVQTGWDEVGEVALNRYLSGDSSHDIWRLPHNAFFSLATRGAFYPVDTVLPQEYFDALPPITQLKNERLRYDGHLLHFSAGVPDDYGHAFFMVANLDMFEQDNLGDPFDLYYNHEWTWETIEDIAQRATRDTDGDGVIDQWGFQWMEPYALIYANGGAITRLTDDDRVEFAMGEQAVVEALRTRYEWENVQGLSIGDYQMREWSNGQTAMAFMPFWQINPDDYDFRYAVLPLPMGPNVDDHVFSPGVADALFIPNNADYPEGLVALDNFLFPLDEYWEVLEDSIGDRALDRDSFAVMMDAFDYFDGDAAYYHNFLGSWWEEDTPYGGVIGGISSGRAPATVINEFAPQAQAMIDETLKQ